MLFTFVVEAILAAYLIWRYKMTTLIRLSVSMLAALAVFQLAEYMVCEGDQQNAIGWSQVGFIAITLLPAMGVHIMQQITKTKSDWMVRAAYFSALAFIITFAFGDAFSAHECTGNYVIFQLRSPFGGAFFIYYFTLLLGTILWGVRAARSMSEEVQSAIYFYILGYFIFIVPALVINVWKPHTLVGLPSIMCGFAILFAAIYTLDVVPRVQAPKKK